MTSFNKAMLLTLAASACIITAVISFTPFSVIAFAKIHEYFDPGVLTSKSLLLFGAFGFVTMSVGMLLAVKVAFMLQRDAEERK